MKLACKKAAEADAEEMSASNQFYLAFSMHQNGLSVVQTVAMAWEAGVHSAISTLINAAAAVVLEGMELPLLQIYATFALWSTD